MVSEALRSFTQPPAATFEGACNTALRGPRRVAGLCAAAQHPAAVASTPPAHAAAPTTPAGRAEAAQWSKHAKIVVLACVARLALRSPAADPALAHAAPPPAPSHRRPRLCRVSAPAHAWYARGRLRSPAAQDAKFRRFGATGAWCRIALKESQSPKSSHLLDSPLGPAGRPSEGSLPTKGPNKLLVTS